MQGNGYRSYELGSESILTQGGCLLGYRNPSNKKLGGIIMVGVVGGWVGIGNGCQNSQSGDHSPSPSSQRTSEAP